MPPPRKSGPARVSASGTPAQLPGLGPASVRMLAAAGLHDVSSLRRAGAVAAFHAVRRADRRASLNLLWALEGALSGRAWQEVARTERMRLLLALDDLERADPHT